MQVPHVTAADWYSLTVSGYSPTTYSTDGSYGSLPQDTNDFTGVTAQDGLRWTGAWSVAPQILGQTLTAPLAAGRRYVLTAFLRTAVRPTLANPGTYQVELWSDAAGTSRAVLGSFAATTGVPAWEPRSLSFVAPANAPALPIIAFRAQATTAGESNLGIDNVALIDPSIDPVGDLDGDGVADADDQCPGSDYSQRVVIDNCETGVTNRLAGNGCTLTDSVRNCQAAGGNHGAFVSCVAALTNTLKLANVITGLEKGQIQSCAAQARTPR